MTLFAFLSLCGIAISSAKDITQWGPLGPSNAPYFSKLYEGMSIEAPFRLRSPSKQFDLIVALDGRLVIYDNNSKQIVSTILETDKEGPYVLSMKQDCKLEYQTNFKVFKELKGSGTCFATVRDNGEVVLLDDYCKTKTSNTDYQDNCTPGEAHGKIKTKPITYTFADEPSKPPIGDSTFEGDQTSGFKSPDEDKKEELPFNPQQECPTGNFVFNPDTKKWDFVPTEEFSKVDPSQIDGWYEYDPSKQEWIYKKNGGQNNTQEKQKLPFDPSSESDDGKWVYNPETQKWEFVPNGSPLPFDETKYPTYPQYTKNPQTNKWDYSQGGENQLPFNPLDDKQSGLYVFNPSKNEWEWYEDESKVPFDFKTGDKPWFTYDGFTKTWKSHTYNPYESYFSNKGQYVVGGDGVSKLYEGQFLVSPSYLTSPGLEYQLILQEDGSLGIYENNGRTLVKNVVDSQGAHNGPFALSMEAECKLVISSKQTYKEIFIGSWVQTCFLFMADDRILRLQNHDCAAIWADGYGKGLYRHICFLRESQKYRIDLPREHPYKIYPGETMTPGQVLTSENNKYQLRLNEKGGLFIWDIETNLFYRKVNDDLGSKSPYNLHINNDCTFVIKDKDGYVVKSYGTAEKSVCFMYLQNNGDFVQFDEECLEKYRTFTALGGSHNRCYFGESIDKAVVNPTDEPSDPEFPIKLYEGQSVQAPFEMRSGNDVTIVRFEEDGNLIIFDNYEHREIKKQWIIPDRFRGQGPFTLSMEAQCSLVARTRNGEEMAKMVGDITKTCFAYARYQKSFVLLDENCIKSQSTWTGYLPEFNNCISGESLEKSLIPNSYNTRIE